MIKNPLKKHPGSFERAISVIIAVIINVLLAFFMNKFKLPLYLDTIGTIGVAATGGLFPGVMVAMLTNVCCSFFNAFSIYYSLISILIAVTTSLFVQYKKFKRKSAIITYLIILALLGGGVGTVFQWVLFGEPQFVDVAQAGVTISEQTGISYFFSSMFVNVGLNLVDKSITSGVAFGVLYFVPEKTKKLMWNSGWKQKPLSVKRVREYNNLKTRGKISLKQRMTGLLIIASISMAVITTFGGLSLYYRNLKAEYTENAIKAAKFAASNVSKDRINTYLNSEQKIADYYDNGYQTTNKLLQEYRESVRGIEYLYVYQIREDGCHIVFDTDPEVQNNGTIGDLIPFDDSFKKYIPKLLAGEEIEVLENDDTYGYFLTAYEPIYDKRGTCVAYAGADASVLYISNYMKDFIMQVLLVFVGFLTLIIIFGYWVTGYDLIYPIRSMATYTNDFINENDVDQKTLDDNVRKIRDLNIHTDDEIEDLYQSICRMASGMAEQMRDIRYYADSTAKMQNGLIITMADMVENRDSDTGAHIQKTAAYVRIILDGLKEKGYYVEKLTPKYMDDVEMSAPLHDVGKINIPDAVLNKPGKLTDEEYEIMKTHTTQGKRIMEKAISTVRGESYLKEARNMAAYHHERWDGKGYPEGLHGEVIPLSARIMSVADVFDALTSARVYKPAFPLEKALNIIQEGAGTQFDPKCVEVFMDNLDKVKLVLKKYNNM